MQVVKLYGGPMHGQIIHLDRVPSRFECMAPEIRRPSVSRVITPPVLKPIDTRAYWVDRFEDYGIQPKRSRTLWYGVIEGERLTRDEEFELDHDLGMLPWTFREFSFLNEFDDWFAERVYAHTGKLMWNGEWVQ